MKKIFVTGICGMLSKSLVKILQDKFEIYGCDIIKNDYLKLDINSNKLKVEIEKIKPDMIIHTAAMINADGCEKDKEKCKKINIDGTENIVKICKELNIKLIYISTSAIFDGFKGNYKEVDIPNPINYYAKTKLDAEKIIQNELEDYLILRINIYGWGNTGFVEWLIGNILSGKEFYVFTDIKVNWLYVDQLSKLIVKIIDKNLKGVYNLGSKDKISKYDFAYVLCQEFGYNNKNIIAYHSDLSNLIAKRPKNITLDISKIENEGIKMPLILEGLRMLKNDL